MSDEKIPLELSLELGGNNKNTIRLNKIIYAGFTPQHGMDIMDTEIVFRVRTIALAGLQALRHTASPLRKGNWIEGSRKVTNKLFPKDEEQYKEALEFFTKQGWKVEQ